MTETYIDEKGHTLYHEDDTYGIMAICPECKTKRIFHNKKVLGNGSLKEDK